MRRRRHQFAGANPKSTTGVHARHPAKLLWLGGPPREHNRSHDRLRRNNRALRSICHCQLSQVPGLPGPGRGFLGLGRGGQPLSRSLQRLGLQPSGTLSAAGRRGGARPGRQADPRAQYVVHRAAGGVRQGAFGTVVRRQVLLLQQRRRGDRIGDQTRPASRQCPGASSRS